MRALSAFASAIRGADPRSLSFLVGLAFMYCGLAGRFSHAVAQIVVGAVLTFMPVLGYVMRR